jgi:hypothetical protein
MAAGVCGEVLLADAGDGEREDGGRAQKTDLSFVVVRGSQGGGGV